MDVLATMCIVVIDCLAPPYSLVPWKEVSVNHPNEVDVQAAANFLKATAPSLYQSSIFLSGVSGGETASTYAD